MVLSEHVNCYKLKFNFYRIKILNAHILYPNLLSAKVELYKDVPYGTVY